MLEASYKLNRLQKAQMARNTSSISMLEASYKLNRLQKAQMAQNTQEYLQYFNAWGIIQTSQITKGMNNEKDIPFQWILFHGVLPR